MERSAILALILLLLISGCVKPELRLENYSEALYYRGNISERVFEDPPVLEPIVELIPPRNITEQAERVRGENISETIDNTFWFLIHIEYQFYKRVRGDEITFKEMKGDCTDISSLGVKLLMLNNITARQVHGWADGHYKHDWIEINLNGTWVARDDYFEPVSLEKVGNGMW